MTLEEVRRAVLSSIIEERRATRVTEWIAGLRRRAQIVDLLGDAEAR
jgi:hypothetical protein